MKKSKVPLFVLQGICIIFFLSCKTPARTAQVSNKVTNENLNINEGGGAADKIAFLTFEVFLADSVNDVYTFRLKHKRFSPGLIKKDRHNDESGIEENYLYFQVSGETEKPVNYQKVQNPLRSVYEYPAEKGDLNKKLVLKKSGELVVRFNYNRDAKYISFFKPDRNTKVLKTIYHALL